MVSSQRLMMLSLRLDDLKQRILKFDLHPELITAVVDTLDMVLHCCCYMLLLVYLITNAVTANIILVY